MMLKLNDVDGEGWLGYGFILDDAQILLF